MFTSVMDTVAGVTLALLVIVGQSYSNGGQEEHQTETTLNKCTLAKCAAVYLKPKQPLIVQDEIVQCDGYSCKSDKYCLVEFAEW